MTRRILLIVGVVLVFGAAGVVAVAIWPERAGEGSSNSASVQTRAPDPPAVTVPPDIKRTIAISRFALLPVTGPLPVHYRFKHPPVAGILFDVKSGAVLWQRNPRLKHPIASLTKMMTALVVVERSAPDDKVRVTKEALAYRGSGIGLLPKGKRVKLETMLNGLLLPSGNDAAIALAQRQSGTVARFVERMNTRARDLGLECTRFSSPDGFVDAGNHSCAIDLAAMARAVLDQPRLARIVRRRRALLPFPIKGGRLYLNNNNPLVRTGYPGVLGIKTGYTDAAGRCLVAAARRSGRRLGVVLLRSPDPARQATQLLNRGFALVA
jgi:serine-type D-Ala-D-Ala carboxypeptidase (penicillin-binding protein 5/6)